MQVELYSSKLGLARWSDITIAIVKHKPHKHRRYVRLDVDPTIFRKAISHT
jgi:hypothetical protein